MTKRSCKLVRLLASSAVMTMLASNAAHGQQAAAPTPVDAAAPGNDAPPPAQAATGDDIIVTATKRTATTQHVPIAIGVISGRAVQNLGVGSLLQIESVAPGVNFAKGPTSTGVAITIRGLGSASGVASFDSSVGLFIDGYYAPREREFSTSMFDVERMEVVRGTQAALLGKNTSLGAVNLITRKPGNTFAVDARANYEFELKSTLLSGGVDIPIGDTLAVRVAGQYDREGGFVKNLLGADGLESRDTSIRTIAVWKPTSKLTVTGLYQHDMLKLTGEPIEYISLNAAAIALQAGAGFPNTLEANLDRRNEVLLDPNGAVSFENLRVDRGTLTIDLDVGGATATSATSYSAYRDDNVGDFDFTAGRYNVKSEFENGKQFTQELRIVSPNNQTLEYVLGGLFVDNTLNFDGSQAAQYPTNVGTFRTFYGQKTKTYSAFGQLTWRVAQGFRLLGGLRYTNETKSGNFERLAVVPGNFLLTYPAYAPFSLRRTENNIDYSAGAQFDVAPDVMIYGSYGQGTKGGGYAPNVSRLDQSEYLKEVARTAEIGIKSQFRSAGVVFNLSLFDTKVQNFQVVAFTGLFQVSNANLHSRGVELEASWRATPNLRLYLNGTYAHARDRTTGNPIPLAPDWTGSSGYNFNLPLSGGLKLVSDGSVEYRSKRYYQLNQPNTPPGAAITRFNASIGLAAINDRWEVRLIGRNLTNRNSIAFDFPTPGVGPGSISGISERPRTIALQLSTKL
ncbi:MAG: hypothetical protein JWR80_8284 [Bradyrhizobium sp.]|nr:hypothetical protein [Bradyrhizobium sp.]